MKIGKINLKYLQINTKELYLQHDMNITFAEPFHTFHLKEIKTKQTQTSDSGESS